MLTPAKIAHVTELLRPLSPHYRQTLHSALRALLRRVGRPDCIAGIQRTPGVQPRETTVPAVELEAVLQAASPALHLAILLARDAGLRIGTIVKLQVADCDFDREEIHTRTKNQHRISIPMTARLRARLLWICAETRSAESTVLELHRPTRKPYGIDAMEIQLRRAKAKAKLTSGWRFHDIRRTTARDLYSTTRDIRKVQRFLGHTNPRTTLWYLGNLAIDLDANEIEAATNQDQRRKEQKA